MIKKTVVVNRPVDDVFDYAVQFERHPEWQSDLKSSKMHGPSEVGATGTDTRQMGRRTHTYEWEVTALDRPSRIAFRTTNGSVRPEGEMRFAADGDGTR